MVGMLIKLTQKDLKALQNYKPLLSIMFWIWGIKLIKGYEE